jgi:hypothetical protein
MFHRRGFIAVGLALLTPLHSPCAEELKWSGLYDGSDFSEQAKLFNGQRVELTGYLAPPLKVDSKFFVLGDLPMNMCPFCTEADQWPTNILLVYPSDRVESPPYDRPVIVAGELDLGDVLDDETKFFSRIRLRNASLRAAPNGTVVKATHK